MLKYVFIDIDNTLLDFNAYVKESLRSGFQKFGIGEYTDATYATFEVENNKLWEALERQELTMQELIACRFNRVFAALGVQGDGPEFEKYFRACLNESAILVDGALEMVQYLSKKYILCAASNGPYHQQLHRLEIGGLLPYFSHMFISEEIGFSKPAKEYFDVAFSRLGENILPKDCLMIGDSLTSDMAGAVGYGMQTCYYNRTGKTSEQHFTYEVAHLRDVLSIL